MKHEKIVYCPNRHQRPVDVQRPSRTEGALVEKRPLPFHRKPRQVIWVLLVLAAVAATVEAAAASQSIRA